MKSFLWDWLLRPGTMVVFVVVFLQSDSSFSMQTLDNLKKSIITFYESAGKEYRQSEGNLGILDLVLTQVYFREYRFPSSYQELVNSPYMVVLPEDFINPYTGNRVQEISGEPEEGNVKFTSTPEEIFVTMFMKAPDVTPPVGLQGLGISPDTPPNTLVSKRGINVAAIAKDHDRRESEEWRKFTIEQSSKWSPERKRFITFCRGVRELMNTATFFYGKVVMDWTWEELLRRMEWRLNLRVRNPSTGGWIKPVDPRYPSPGDFSVIYLWRDNSRGNPRVDDFCTVYDGKGNPIFDPRLISILEKHPEFRVLR